MDFALYKTLAALVMPLPLLVLAVLSGLALIVMPAKVPFRKTLHQTGQCILVLAGGVFVLAGFFPLGHNLLVRLERPVPAVEIAEMSPINGIIILGGGIDTRISVSRNTALLNGAGDRIITFIRLARRHENARLLYTGGSGDPDFQSVGEAEVARQFIKDLAPDILPRLTTEARSRTTYENAMSSIKYLSPAQRRGNWVLITSAVHMKRAMAVFKSAGFGIEGKESNLFACPTDYRTDGTYAFMPSLDILGNITQLHLAWHELLGYAHYRLTGKITPESTYKRLDTCPLST